MVRYASVFKSLYASCIQRTRKRRSDMLAGLLRRYDALHAAIDPAVADKDVESVKFIGNAKYIPSDKLNERLDVIAFMMATIAYLPFETNDEPLVAIHWINRIASGHFDTCFAM